VLASIQIAARKTFTKMRLLAFSANVFQLFVIASESRSVYCLKLKHAVSSD
jgi:hypothetical protein